ncbi:DUF6794 domain-containing protein [Breznakiella homolactica]|uniref:DUF6794 domain-containing protein n=1 Tax=Breznakiella homolactica TaxID=2798577 RepID=A0A7T8B9W5_9SPIR|nr:DUF6794 domain-containing protein [Breznakiella homolactica]QQO07608.1 hypothetical protein JFL75_11690 [Breznakiella homolactica]
MRQYAFIILCICLAQNGYAQNNQPHKLDIKAYLNDVEIAGPVYDNGTKSNIYDNYSNAYVGLVNIFDLLGAEAVIDGNTIKINSQKLGNFVITYDGPDAIVFNPRPSPFPSTRNSIIIIDDEFYIRINLVRYIVSGYTVENDKKVTLYTRDYERHDLPELNIKAYLNDTQITGSVYKNIFGPPVQGLNYLSSFVNLVNIFSALESETKVNGNTVEIIGPNIGKIKIIYENQTNIIIDYISEELELNPPFTNNTVVIIDDEYYITISMVRYLIDGALAQDEEKVTLYTSDYERLDIPLTLYDCYLALDALLNNETKDDIKKSTVNDLIEYHMGLGMWIRNNWIRQTNHRITKLLFDNGLRHPDDMSQLIIIGYHYYLNHIDKSIEELIHER